MDTNTRRSTAETNRSTAGTTAREVVTAFYAAFNRLVADRGGRAELAATLTDDVVWTAVTNGDGSERSYTGVDGVVKSVAPTVRERADHAQALPERFVETDGTVVVEGAYVGTADGTEFDVPFVHVYELDGERIRRCRAYTDTALERNVFGS